ncbi:kynurenine 3-monooxygenase [Streptomyces sp. L-9-10]|uniref:FAD-dependent oxidoreductase n=1 Tax=Streptomyces sp. L-9-10 TaxID=1478131 RepID=UPI0010D4F6C6|nr:FAD-dependent monooxygenase [Streptomyces sp. L-9-10]RYJ31937.1 kynurenine 3-monooxygenase [Streptomyces sp. L-9-10]
MKDIAIIGGGPGGLTAAIALARRGIRSTVFERDGPPETMPRFNPDRSYPIDLTGHGLRAVRHIDAVAHFDAHMTPFRGIRNRGRIVDAWSEPGWIGSRGDITRALMSVAEERHRGLIDFAFDSGISTVDVRAGTVAGRTFDLVVGADGAGSVVRTAMREQIEGFTVETGAIPNYGLVLELDRVGDQLDRRYLNGLAMSPLTLTGVILDESRPDGVRWICFVGVNKPIGFASPEQAATWLRRYVPLALDLTSERAVADFSGREAVHLGQRLTCSRLYGGRAVLIGDAAAAFPPIGQGGNAALESAVVLDEILASGPPETAGARFEAAWKPEADALTWISGQVRYQSPWATARVAISQALGVNVIREAKSSTRSYADVRRSARRLGPLWA